MDTTSLPHGLGVRQDVPLAPYTTLELGGPARYFVEVTDDWALVEALRWAASKALPVRIIGGGSNLLVADEGYDGLVVRMANRGVSMDPEPHGGRVLVTAQAGDPWDSFVESTVRNGLWGLECLSGIPGSVGATPIQNVGAYGREVSEAVHSVHVLERTGTEPRTIPGEACRFAYRHSRFKEEQGRFAILAVTFSLSRGESPPDVGHPELARRLQALEKPTGAAVRDAVLALRRSKSMVLDPGDPNRRSVGSFFLNPLLPAGTIEAVARRARASGLAVSTDDIPRYPAAEDRVKLSAAWLIEKAGFPRGLRRGNVGISSNHVLALVHHGGGTTAELLSLAEEVRARVAGVFGIALEIEPVWLGSRPFDRDSRV